MGTAPVTAIATFHRLMGYGAVKISGRGGKSMCRLLLLRISQQRPHQRRRRRTLAAFALPLLLLLLSLRGVCAVLASWAVGGLLFCLRSKGRVVRRFAKATVLFCVVGKRKNTQLQFRAERTGARQHEAYIHAGGLTNPPHPLLMSAHKIHWPSPTRATPESSTSCPKVCHRLS